MRLSHSLSVSLKAVKPFKASQYSGGGGQYERVSALTELRFRFRSREFPFGPSFVRKRRRHRRLLNCVIVVVVVVFLQTRIRRRRRRRRHPDGNVTLWHPATKKTEEEEKLQLPLRHVE